MTEPQPIETALRDRRILVFVPDHDGNAIESGWFSAQWNDFNGKWECGYFDGIDVCVQLEEPTHWMLLPASPIQHR